MRSKFQDYNGGAGIGYKLSDKLSLGFSGLISYKDDQYYNLITVDVFTMPGPDPYGSHQYLSDSRYHIKYNMYDVRLTTKIGLHLKQNSWSFGANINLPSVKLFGNGTVVKQYEYSNIHREAGNAAGFNRYYSGLGYRSIILGMQFSYGQDKNQQQVINFTEPVEYLDETILPLTGPLNSQVLIRYYDVAIYFGFLFNFLNK